MTMNKKALCIYHKVDYDGVFSYLIINKWFNEHKLGDEILDSIGWTYGTEFPKIDFYNYNLVIIADLMLPPELMKSIHSVTNLIWIDHHLGNIEYSEKYNFSDIAGIRKIGIGACELCWEFFFRKDLTIKTPELIQLASAYDVWDHERFNWNTRTLPLQLGLKTLYGVNPIPIEPIFEELIGNNKKLLEQIITTGQTIKTFNDNNHKIACKNYSFPVTVAGKYRGICCITTEFGSAIFDSLAKEDYDVFICTNRKTTSTGEVIYPTSMYSNIDKNELNLAKYMQGYNGNGHFHAAGGSLTEEQFKRLIFNQEI